LFLALMASSRSALSLMSRTTAAVTLGPRPSFSGAMRFQEAKLPSTESCARQLRDAPVGSWWHRHPWQR
jgi:hypothetical protein